MVGGIGGAQSEESGGAGGAGEWVDGGVAGGDHRQGECCVGGGAGHHAPGAEEVRPRRLGAGGNEPLGGLEPGESAQRGRDPDRATAVAAGGEGHHACRQCCGRSARRTAGGPGGVERVDRWAHHGVVGLGGVAVLGGVGLAHHDGSRSAQRRHRHAVGSGGGRVGEQGGAPGGAQSGSVLEVLDPHRHTGEQEPRRVRTGGERLVERRCSGHGALGVGGHEGADAAVEPFDRLERGGGDLAGGEFAPTHGCGDVGHRGGGEVHGSSRLWWVGRRTGPIPTWAPRDGQVTCIVVRLRRRCGQPPRPGPCG